MKLYAFYPASEVKKYNEMSFVEQLHYAHKHKLTKPGTESKSQDGGQDPFQDDSHDPWMGKKKPEEHKMYTPPQSARSSTSPRPGAPPGLSDPLPGKHTLESTFPQAAPEGLSDEEKKGDLSVLLRSASEHGVPLHQVRLREVAQ